MRSRTVLERLLMGGKLVSKRRVVITGLGIISPLGNRLEEAWQSAISGKSGVRRIEAFDTQHFTTQFAGLVSNFNASEYMSEKEARKCDVFIQYGVAAAKEAVENAGLSGLASKEQTLIDLDRVGVSIGSGIGGIGTIEHNHQILSTIGPKRISPFFIPATIINMISGYVSIQHGFRGPNIAIATACTTGTHSIGFAARFYSVW